MSSRTLASDLAQAIYLFIPSRAVHHSKADPWKINLANLFDQLAMNVPSSKSLRKKALVQHGEKSVVKQLKQRSNFARISASFSSVEQGQDRLALLGVG